MSEPPAASTDDQIASMEQAINAVACGKATFADAFGIEDVVGLLLRIRALKAERKELQRRAAFRGA
jgi:hypothetical protein